MADHVIRFVQCPYCKNQFGVRYDQAVEHCFFCEGTINLEPTEYKEGLVSSLLGKLSATVKEQIENARQKGVEEKAVRADPFVNEFSESLIEEEDDDYLGFDKESIVPLKERLFKDRDEEPIEFDPMELIESDLLDEESVFPESVPVPIDPVEILYDAPFVDDTPRKASSKDQARSLDPIDRLRPAADDIPTYPRRDEEFEEEEESPFFTRQRVILFSVILGGILLILILMFIRDIMM